MRECKDPCHIVALPRVESRYYPGYLSGSLSSAKSCCILVSTSFNAAADMYLTTHFATNGMKRSVNTAGGFSITEFINPSSGIGDRAIPHGLGAIPDFVIFKPHTATGSWIVLHKSMGSNSTLSANRAVLDTSVVEATYPSVTAATAYHVRTSGTAGWDINIAGRSVMLYAWKAVSGVSAFGSYTGTAGALSVTVGFKPRFLLIKNIYNFFNLSCV